MSVGTVNKNTGDRIPTAGNPLDKVGNLASLHTTEKSDAVSAINEVKDEQANKADNDIVADAFNAVETYAEGDYCTYEGGLYKFKTSHSGAWDAADVDQIQIAGELSELKNTLANLFITGHTTLVWNDYEGRLTKEILGVTDCKNYIWNLRSVTWENIIFTSSIGVNYIGIRAWEKTTPNAEQISLKRTGSLEIYWEGIYLGRSI